LGGWRAVVFPYISGSPPDLLNEGTVVLMGRALATLHRAMAKLPLFDLAMVESGRRIDHQYLDAMIELRRSALRYWLDHLDEAPIGIRSSSPEWHTTLRSFAARSFEGGGQLSSDLGRACGLKPSVDGVSNRLQRLQLAE
jgi:hypothetical protein